MRGGGRIMAKKAILVISIILVSSLFLGCVDTDSVGLGSIGGTTDPIAKSEKSGIFSEDVKGFTESYQYSHIYGVYIAAYEAVYNNGDTIEIYYDGKRRTEQVVVVKLWTKEVNDIEEFYAIKFENEKPTEYLYHYTNYGEDYAIRDAIYWDATGRVDPRSDGDIDRANKFIEAGLKKGKQVKERFYAKELGDWS